MANGGWYGTREEWERIEKSLLDVESTIEEFVEEFSLNMSKNHKGWPEWSIVWGKEVRCLIQLYLADKNLLTFNLWLCAYEDRGSKRYWKQETPIKQKQVSEFRDNLASQLRAGRKQLLDWSDNKDQLELSTKLG